MLWMLEYNISWVTSATIPFKNEDACLNLTIKLEAVFHISFKSSVNA